LLRFARNDEPSFCHSSHSPPVILNEVKNRIVTKGKPTARFFTSFRMTDTRFVIIRNEAVQTKRVILCKTTFFISRFLFTTENLYFALKNTFRQPLLFQNCFDEIFICHITHSFLHFLAVKVFRQIMQRYKKLRSYIFHIQMFRFI